MTDQTPSPAAMRAARLLFPETSSSKWEGYARIIDRETGVVELRAAAQLLIDLVDNDCITATKLPHVYRLGLVMEIAKARAVVERGK